MSLLNIEKSTVVFFVLGLLIGIQFFDGGPPFYSKVEMPTSVSSSDYYEITKLSIPFMSTSIKIEFYEWDSESSEHRQKCKYAYEFEGYIEDLVFFNSDGEAIWIGAGTLDNNAGTRDPNIELEMASENLGNDCLNDYSDVWSVTIKMNSEPATVHDYDDEIVRSF